MPSTDRTRTKSRKGGGSFTRLPHHVFRTSGDRPAPIAVLSPAARALLVDICAQLNGRNNGNLSAAPKVMEPYGWTTPSHTNALMVELVVHGFVVQTRQGGLNRCSLYGVTWLGIDEGPHDAKPDPVPSRLWEADRADQRDPSFVRRWSAIKEGRRSKIAKPCLSREKPSLSRDKSASRKVA